VPQQLVWGLISDVHGNRRALAEALTVLRQAGAQKLAFLGDYLGRGDSDGCVQIIQEVADAAIVGNRDLDWQDRVSSASKAWVLSLPRTACLNGLLISHGDPRLTPELSTGQIGREFVRAWSVMEALDVRVWAFGHSHFARTWRKASPESPAELERECRVPMATGYRYALNVGTTGLPFPGKGGPSVALVDLALGELRHLSLGRPQPGLPRPPRARE
jgi:predicted phosphodiesterase